MKKRSLFNIGAALLILPSGYVLAAEDVGLRGSVELGGWFNDSEDQSAKFLEYQDPESGVISRFSLDGYRDAYFFGVEARNAGRDDQRYEITGGLYDSFKFSAFYDEMIHNLSFGTKTFYSGVGTGNLTVGPPAPADPSTWNSFDYTIEKEQYGTDIEFFTGSPFFFQIDVDRVEKDGLKPLGSGGFGGAFELPEPVDYTTDNVIFSGGYRSREISFKLSGMYSTFSNENDFLEWESPSGALDYNSLPQDNDYGKVNASFAWRQLPMMSAWTVKASYANLTNDFSTSDYGATQPAGLNTTEFEGDVKTTKFATALTSRPIADLDTKIFFDYYDKENDSTVVLYTGGGNDTHLFDYTKYSLGFDGIYKLTSNTKLSGGYSFEDVDRRNRPDSSENIDNLFFVKAKNSSLDFMTAEVGYTILLRDTDEDFDLTGLTPADAEFIRQFVQRYDTTSKTRNELKFAFEFYPLSKLDLGVEYSFVNNDYDDVVLGRTEDTGHELYFDFMWRAAGFLHLTGFAGYENYESDSNHYSHRAGFGGQTANPTVNDGNPASFLWSQFDEEDFWTVGLAADMPLMRERLLLHFSAQYQESDGSSDFATEGPAPLESIEEFEDYYITTLESKATYAVTESLDCTLGYLYGKSNYDDLQYQGYEYDPGGTLLSGAYADHDYEAHVGYVTVKYSF